jgi:integrase
MGSSDSGGSRTGPVISEDPPRRATAATARCDRLRGAQRGVVEVRLDDAPCRICGGPVDQGASRRSGRRRLHCHSCRPPVVKRPVAEVGLDELVNDLAGDLTVSSTQRAVLARALKAAEAAGWSTNSLDRVLAGLRAVLDGHPDGQPIRLSQLGAAIGASTGLRIARMAQILDELELLVDDTAPTIRTWIDHSCDALPAGFSVEVRAWLLVLLEGDERARPRSQSTLYAYFGRVRPHLVAWSATRDQLREITDDDVCAVLDRLSGHRRAGTFTALRSLFRFAKRRRLLFVDPTRRLHVGRAPGRVLLPMTDAQIAAVERVAVTPAQRLVVALAAIHAARASAIRELTLDDVDLPGRRIRLGGHSQRLSEFVHHALVDWLQHRQRTWPHTQNRHVLVSTVTATGTEPVSDYYLSWHLLQRGVQLEQIRGDRVLQEALAVGADPLHLAAAFNLSSTTAIAYADIARSLLARPIEDSAAVSPTATNRPRPATDPAQSAGPDWI